MNIDISISRKGVMGIVEGISVTIAQHNNGTPTFEQLWASDNESPKLDIYYREGIGDLERHLEKWISNSSGQFDLQAVGSDYTLSLELNDNWPSKLKGLLSNKVQDYMVHTITAGWLNDFDGLNVKQDYQAMAATDLDDIEYIIGLKTFGFDESERSTDAEKDADGYAVEAGARTADNDAAVNGNAQNTAGERTADAEKTTDDNAQIAGGERHDKNDTDIALKGDALNEAGDRNKDNAEIMITRDFTDWSGVGVPFFPMDVL